MQLHTTMINYNNVCSSVLRIKVLFQAGTFKKQKNVSIVIMRKKTLSNNFIFIVQDDFYNSTKVKYNKILSKYNHIIKPIIFSNLNDTTLSSKKSSQPFRTPIQDSVSNLYLWLMNSYQFQ